MKKTLLVISMLVASHSMHSLKASEQWANDMEQWIAGNQSITSAERTSLDNLKSQYGRIKGIQKWQEERINASTVSSKASEPALTAEQQWANDMEKWIQGNPEVTKKEKDRLQTLKSQYGRIGGYFL